MSNVRKKTECMVDTAKSFAENARIAEEQARIEYEKKEQEKQRKLEKKQHKATHVESNIQKLQREVDETKQAVAGTIAKKLESETAVAKDSHAKILRAKDAADRSFKKTKPAKKSCWAFLFCCGGKSDEEKGLLQEAGTIKRYNNTIN